MGVIGLWTVVQPCARPTNLATLNRKRLAVDASIWIYQFLKAVRDKEGNALRNSHVVGFFRRICKLLWYGIKPVFVFDGGAPALKRATLQARRKRREGRREDAVRTAGKLLAVQMQRMAQEEEERRKERKRRRVQGPQDGVEPAEELPDVEMMVYADEAFKPEQERKRDRKFFKQDQYHLPHLDICIDRMGKPEDPRIMTVEELEEYARQFHNGEDVNLYDFSNIDFDGEFFKSLPPADRYNILNAARVRSRLRMGLSKEQLDSMFPNRMDFSRFQIERVQERNRLTQRLMFEMNMAGTDLTVTGGGRIAGEKNREYILVRNESAEGGWALGVVSTEKDLGEAHKPIDVDRIHLRVQAKEDEDDDEWEDENFEDVPIEGLNRLPKIQGRRVRFECEEDDNLFVDQENEEQLVADEEEDVARAIEISLRNQPGIEPQAKEDQVDDFEEVHLPQWKQTAVQAPKPIASASGGSRVAQIINTQANAAVSKSKHNADSDSEQDLQEALRTVRKKKKDNVAGLKNVAPIRPNVKHPFDGPLPFEKLSWRTSLFEKRSKHATIPEQRHDEILECEGAFQTALRGDDSAKVAGQEIYQEDPTAEEDQDPTGGFEREPGGDEAPKPLPPWLINDETDIRESMKKQRRLQNEMNEEDQRLAEEEDRLRRKRQNEVIELESSDDDGDIEIVVTPQVKQVAENRTQAVDASLGPKIPSTSECVFVPEPISQEISESIQSTVSPVREGGGERVANPEVEPPSPSMEMAFEEVELPQVGETAGTVDVEIKPRNGSNAVEVANLRRAQPPEIATDMRGTQELAQSEAAPLEDGVSLTRPLGQKGTFEGTGTMINAAQMEDDYLFSEGDQDEFSDPEEEQLLAQMAEEVEEHGRFTSQLNNRTAFQNQEDYDGELRALRTQQKKDRRDADEVTQTMVNECQALLRLFGIPFITAPMEAEAQCAELVHLGLADGIVTDDSDIFLFGGTRVYKNMFNSNKFVECYLSGDLEKELSLSRENLISIAHLLGSDYIEGLPGIGPVTAVEILSEFPGREGLTEFKNWWTQVQQNPGLFGEGGIGTHSTFRKKFRKSQASKLFLPPSFPSPAVYDAYLHPDVDKNTEEFQWGVPDLEGLRRFLMATIGWSQERTNEVLVPVIRDMNRREMEGTQSNMTKYFEGTYTVGVGAKETFAPRQRQAVRSKRLVAAVNRLRANVSGGAAEEAAGSAAVANAPGPARKEARKRKIRALAVAQMDEGVEEREGEEEGEEVVQVVEEGVQDRDTNMVDRDGQTTTAKGGGRKKGHRKRIGKKPKTRMGE